MLGTKPSACCMLAYSLTELHPQHLQDDQVSPVAWGNTERQVSGKPQELIFLTEEKKIGTSRVTEEVLLHGINMRQGTRQGLLRASG